MGSDRLKGYQSKGGVPRGSTSGPRGWPDAPLVNKASQNVSADAYMPGRKGSVSADLNPPHVSDVTRDATGGGIKSSPHHTRIPDGAIAKPRVATAPFTRGAEHRHSSSSQASARPYDHRGRNKPRKSKP
jgi:hypothetical protein